MSIIQKIGWLGSKPKGAGRERVPSLHARPPPSTHPPRWGRRAGQISCPLTPWVSWPGGAAAVGSSVPDAASRTAGRWRGRLPVSKSTGSGWSIVVGWRRQEGQRDAAGGLRRGGTRRGRGEVEGREDNGHGTARHATDCYIFTHLGHLGDGDSERCPTGACRRWFVGKRKTAPGWVQGGRREAISGRAREWRQGGGWAHR